jgi:hypothetical protein
MWMSVKLRVTIPVLFQESKELRESKGVFKDELWTSEI